MSVLDWFRRTPTIGDISITELEKAKAAIEQFAVDHGLSPVDVMATFDDKNMFVSAGFPPNPFRAPKT